MARLEDIPKKHVFTVPDGYFEKLPGVVQSRVNEPASRKSVVYTFGLRYALPVVLLLTTVFYFTQMPVTESAESMLATLHTDHLLEYLEEGELSTDDLLEDVDFTLNDLEQIENQAYDFGSQILYLDNFEIEGP